jgi:HAD superfamily hydrolase (TIGR01509 family)
VIRAFIFDLDGTLLDSEVLWVEALDEFLKGRNMPLPWDEVVGIVYGKSWHDIHREVVRRLPNLGLGLEAMQEALGVLYQRRRATRDVRIPGSVRLLRRLACRGKVCIVSGSLRQDIAEAVGHLGIEREVAFFLGSEDYAPGKPDPACFLLAARNLGCEPSECVVFEDSAAGVRAAARAGMRCVALAREGAPPQDVGEADLVLKDLDEFTEASLAAPRAGRGAAP